MMPAQITQALLLSLYALAVAWHAPKVLTRLTATGLGARLGIAAWLAAMTTALASAAIALQFLVRSVIAGWPRLAGAVCRSVAGGACTPVVYRSAMFELLLGLAVMIATITAVVLAWRYGRGLQQAQRGTRSHAEIARMAGRQLTAAASGTVRKGRRHPRPACPRAGGVLPARPSCHDRADNRGTCRTRCRATVCRAGTRASPPRRPPPPSDGIDPRAWRPVPSGAPIHGRPAASGAAGRDVRRRHRGAARRPSPARRCAARHGHWRAGAGARAGRHEPCDAGQGGAAHGTLGPRAFGSLPARAGSRYPPAPRRASPDHKYRGGPRPGVTAPGGLAIR